VHPQIGVGDDFVLFEGGVELAVVQIIFGKAADRIEIVAIQNDGVLVGIDSAFVVLALLIGGAQCGIELGRASGVRNRAQNFQGVSGVSLVCVEHGQGRDGFFRAGIELDRRLELGFRLLHIIVEAIERPRRR